MFVSSFHCCNSLLHLCPQFHRWKTHFHSVKTHTVLFSLILLRSLSQNNTKTTGATRSLDVWLLFVVHELNDSFSNHQDHDVRHLVKPQMLSLVIQNTILIL